MKNRNRRNNACRLCVIRYSPLSESQSFMLYPQPILSDHPPPFPQGNLSLAKAFWVSVHTLAVPPGSGEESYSLVASRLATLELTGSSIKGPFLPTPPLSPLSLPLPSGSWETVRGCHTDLPIYQSAASMCVSWAPSAELTDVSALFLPCFCCRC